MKKILLTIAFVLLSSWASLRALSEFNYIDACILNNQIELLLRTDEKDFSQDKENFYWRRVILDRYMQLKCDTTFQGSRAQELEISVVPTAEEWDQMLERILDKQYPCYMGEVAESYAYEPSPCMIALMHDQEQLFIKLLRYTDATGQHEYFNADEYNIYTGRALIHYAIRGSLKNALDELIKLGVDLQVKTLEGIDLLTLARTQERRLRISQTMQQVNISVGDQEVQSASLYTEAQRIVQRLQAHLRKTQAAEKRVLCTAGYPPKKQSFQAVSLPGSTQELTPVAMNSVNEGDVDIYFDDSMLPPTASNSQVVLEEEQIGQMGSSLQVKPRVEIYVDLHRMPGVKILRSAGISRTQVMQDPHAVTDPNTTLPVSVMQQPVKQNGCCSIQ